MPLRRPQVVAFDVVETLFPLEPLSQKLTDIGLPVHALPLWFSRLLRDGFALDASGVFKSFPDVAASALEVLMDEHGVAPDKGKVDAVLGGFSSLRAHVDVAPTFTLLRDQAVRVVSLTNGSASTTQKLLKHAGVDGMVERVISIDEVKHWKPRAEVYLHAAKVCGVAPADMALVAVHAWDTHGASRAGLITAWVARNEKRFPSTMDLPDIKAPTLVDTVKGLLATP